MFDVCDFNDDVLVYLDPAQEYVFVEIFVVVVQQHLCVVHRGEVECGNSHNSKFVYIGASIEDLRFDFQFPVPVQTLISNVSRNYHFDFTIALSTYISSVAFLKATQKGLVLSIRVGGAGGSLMGHL